MQEGFPARGIRTTDMRLPLVEFLIQSTEELDVGPIVKYAALSLFADRFYPSLSRFAQGNDKANWLLQPIRESNLQLFALISIWISSKIHDSCPLPVKCLKFLGDTTIKEQHFTTRDFLEAEVVFLQVLDFEIGTANNAFVFLEELYIQFKGIAKVGELLNFEACMDIMDLVYEKEETSLLHSSHLLAASILVASYVITVPKKKWEFPVLPWVKFVTSCEEEHIIRIVTDILRHVFGPSCLLQVDVKMSPGNNGEKMVECHSSISRKYFVALYELWALPHDQLIP